MQTKLPCTWNAIIEQKYKISMWNLYLHRLTMSYMKNESRIKHQMLLGVNLAKEVKDVYSEN